MGILRRETVYLWYYFDLQFRQIFWYWVLGMTLGSAISVFAKEKIHNAVKGLSDKKMGAFGVIPASILGIASPFVYVWHDTPRRQFFQIRHFR